MLPLIHPPVPLASVAGITEHAASTRNRQHVMKVQPMLVVVINCQNQEPPCAEDITQTHAETDMRDAHADTHRQNPRSFVLLISLRVSNRTRLSFLASTCSTVLAFCLGPNRFGANRTVFNGAL